jgi:hypothetical protein
MHAAPRYRYEVQYDVSPRRQRAYDRWISTAILEWVGQAEFEGFQTFRSDGGSSSATKLVFEFTDRAAWDAFAHSDAHGQILAGLQSLTATLETSLWKPSVIPLSGDDGQSGSGSAPRDDSDRPGERN